MTDHTPMSKVARLEVISVGARRHWALAEKQRIVTESYAAPRQVSATARRNGLSASQLFTWRRLARDGRLSGDEMTFASAVIGDAGSSGNRSFLPDQSAVSDRSLPPPATSGRIEIVLVGGHRVVVDNSVDAAALARVLAVLERP